MQVAGYLVWPDRQSLIIFRGTFSLLDAVKDALISLDPFISPGIKKELINVHRGFLGAYNDVADDVLDMVTKAHMESPGYRIIVTDGHRSWGYEHFTTEYWQFRYPLPIFDKRDRTVRKCDGPEDPSCSDSIFTTGIHPAHTYYFGQRMLHRLDVRLVLILRW
ncbi:hypothetical protein FB451DRAFT_1549496 [Mycena latifolia]|nr:hypothetical protein FB451DRAFT_1549496 [Mycena latifolia]